MEDLKNGDHVAFFVKDGEEPIILETRAAGFKFTTHWVTLTTTETIRDLTVEANTWSPDEQRANYRELSLILIRDGKRLDRISRRRQEDLHNVFAEWCVLRKVLFGKDLPFATDMQVVGRVEI